MFNVVIKADVPDGPTVASTTKDSSLEECIANHEPPGYPVFFFENDMINTGIIRLIANSINRSHDNLVHFETLLTNIFEAGRKFQRSLGFQPECECGDGMSKVSEGNGKIDWRCESCHKTTTTDQA